MAVVLGRRAERPKKWSLTSLQRNGEVILAIDHERRSYYSRRKVHWVNLWQDPNYGLPAGLTLYEFMNVMHHEQDQQNPGRILQGIPWPVLGEKTDYELRAIYEYLRAIPSFSARSAKPSDS